MLPIADALAQVNMAVGIHMHPFRKGETLVRAGYHSGRRPGGQAIHRLFRRAVFEEARAAHHRLPHARSVVRRRRAGLLDAGPFDADLRAGYTQFGGPPIAPVGPNFRAVPVASGSWNSSSLTLRSARLRSRNGRRQHSASSTDVAQ